MTANHHHRERTRRRGPGFGIAATIVATSFLLGPIGGARAEGRFEVLRGPDGASAQPPYPLSADGSTAVMERAPEDPTVPWERVVWHVDGRISTIPSPPGAPDAPVVGLSADGNRVYLRTDDGVVTWSMEAGHVSYAIGDGSGVFRGSHFASETETLVGSWHDPAGFRLAFWSLAEGLRPVPDSLSPTPYDVHALSRDGRVVVASTTLQDDTGPAPVWYARTVVARDTGIERRLDSSDTTPVHFRSDLRIDARWIDSVSRDGSTVHARFVHQPSSTFCVGVWQLDADPLCLFFLDKPDPFVRGLAGPLSVTADEQVVMGWDGWTEPLPGASSGESDWLHQDYVIDATRGPSTVEAFLRDAHGLDLQGVHDLGPTAIVASGRVLVGSGLDAEDRWVGWRAILDPSCADGFDDDGDGAVDFPDDPGCSSDQDTHEGRREGVVIDVEPRRATNEIVITRPVLVTVGLLGSDEIDASAVDPDSLRLGPANARSLPTSFVPASGDGSVGDLNGDGHLDRSFVFVSTDLGLAMGDATICLTGEIHGDVFRACDAVVPVFPGCGGGFAVAWLVPVIVLARRWG